MKQQKRARPSSKRKQILCSFCFLFLILTSIPTVSLDVRAEEVAHPVSPALCILAEESSMAMAALKGNDIAFDSDDFARAMNLSKVSHVTITKVPPIADGELRIGTTVVNSGQTVSAANLALMTYTASRDDVTSTSFRFRVGDSPVEMTCHLYLLERVNHSPTLNMVPKTSLNVSTHRNITLYGTLPCYDPDGDETTIEIVSYPESGILVLTDRHTGEYTFTPDENNSGKDSFTYVARDPYGNYSAAATVSLTVTKPSTSVVYADLTDAPCHNAALTMTEAGIMSGTQVGTSTYFYPTRTVSRGEFLVMAMNAMGMTEVTDSAQTVFADDRDIPTSIKGYVATAYELGYIHGELAENGQLRFCPTRAITRAEVAVMLGNMLNVATPTVTPSFSDSSEIPAWAASSIYSMNALGIMTTSGGNISPRADLTRADAAEILAALMQVAE